MKFPVRTAFVALVLMTVILFAYSVSAASPPDAALAPTPTRKAPTPTPIAPPTGSPCMATPCGFVALGLVSFGVSLAGRRGKSNLA